LICVEVFRPIDVARIAELLTPHFRPFQVHIPYTLQLLIEFGIQGVTPFYIRPEAITVTRPRTTFCEIEISIKKEGIMEKILKPSNPACPFPPPLSSSPGNDELVCEVLRALWEEEFSRSSRPFPYTPEGMVDGLHRPDCSEMPHVERRREKKKIFLSSLEIVATESTPPSTQGLLNDLIGNVPLPIDLHQSQYDLSLGDEDTRTDIPPTVLQISPTVVVAEEQVVAEQTNTAAEPQRIISIKNPAPIMRPLLPNKACLLRYSIPPPRTGSVPSQPHRLTLTANTAPMEGPLRTIKPLDHLTQPTGQESLTFCTLAVIELIVDSQTDYPDYKTDPVLAVTILVVDERLEDSERIFLFLNSEDTVSPPSCEVENSLPNKPSSKTSPNSSQTQSIQVSLFPGTRLA